MAEQTRDQIKKQDKWRLEDIYATDEAWEADYARLAELMQEAQDVAAFKEKLTRSAKSLGKALKKLEEMEHIAASLYVYARMRRDEDNTNPTYQALVSRAVQINVELSSATAFVNPTLLSLKTKQLDAFLAAALDGSAPKLSDFSFFLQELKRGKAHVLSEKEERLLAMSGEIAGAPKDIFNMLNDADMIFGSVKDDAGVRVELSQGKYIVMMQNPDRNVRKRAYQTFYKAYQQHGNTIATTYAASVKKDVFYAKAKNFNSALEKSLFADHVPVSLYENLIETIHENLPIMHRYLDVRRHVLGVDQLAMYDIYAPLVPKAKKEFKYPYAMRIVKEGLAVLGEEYAALLADAQKNGWIDVYETAGKTSGAYSWGVYGVHPFVMLNHRGDLDSVYTIAHELGHAMHSHFASQNQCEAKAGYTIFVAEVASTVNEILLTHHLLETTKDQMARRYVLNHYLDQFRMTVLRQTMFAEFEKMTHEQVESGGALTLQSLCEMYGNLNALYHGEAMRDNTISHEWSRIPHFYNAFYVYKYATGFSCAVQIATDILSGREGAVRDYIAFLSSGGSDHPLELLKIAGVHLEGGEPVRVCMQEFSKALDVFVSGL